MNLYRRANLSPMEIRVCDLLLQGKTISEIADEMYRSYKTVATYKYRAFEKLGVRNEVELFRLKLKRMEESADMDRVVSWRLGYREAIHEALA